MDVDMARTSLGYFEAVVLNETRLGSYILAGTSPHCVYLPLL